MLARSAPSCTSGSASGQGRNAPRVSEALRTASERSCSPFVLPDARPPSVSAAETTASAHGAHQVQPPSREVQHVMNGVKHTSGVKLWPSYDRKKHHIF